MHICSTWSEDVCVVLGLSSYYTDLKLTTFTNKTVTSGDACPQRGFILCVFGKSVGLFCDYISLGLYRIPSKFGLIWVCPYRCLMGYSIRSLNSINVWIFVEGILLICLPQFYVHSLWRRRRVWVMGSRYERICWRLEGCIGNSCVISSRSYSNCDYVILFLLWEISLF